MDARGVGPDIRHAHTRMHAVCTHARTQLFLRLFIIKMVKLAQVTTWIILSISLESLSPYHLRHVACCMLHVPCCMLHDIVACCTLHVTCYMMLHVACCMLHVACCMLHVACCMMHGSCIVSLHRFNYQNSSWVASLNFVM